MTNAKSFRLLIGSIVIGGSIFLFFEYLFKAPVFVKVFGFLALAFVVYLAVDWIMAAFKKKGRQGADQDFE